MISAYLTAVIPALALPWLLLPLRNQVAFAVLPVVPIAVVFAKLIREQRSQSALSVSLLWALAVSISTIAAAAVFPEAAAKSIWHASAYRDEMLRWIATGRGAEGNIKLFLPRVLVEYALVLGLSAVSIGAAALLLGGLLLGYMNGYVGWVVVHADPSSLPLVTAATAWPPWSVCRVVSFVLAGTAAAAWGYPRILARGSQRTPVARYVIASAVFLLADIGLKWWLAPIWRELLSKLLGASAGIEAGGTG
jgi:hypothetical protein